MLFVPLPPIRYLRAPLSPKDYERLAVAVLRAQSQPQVEPDETLFHAEIPTGTAPYSSLLGYAIAVGLGIGIGLGASVLLRNRVSNDRSM